MNRVFAVIAVIVAAIAGGTAGYFAATKTGGPDAAEIAAAVDTYLAEHPKLVGDSGTQAQSADEALSESQVAAVEGIVRDHLIANPEIVRDAINELQRKEIEAEAAAQKTAISEDSELIFAAAHDPVVGNPDGEVTLVEFFDYNCGYCKRAHADMKRLLEEDPNLKIILKEFPVLGEGSVEAAHVSAAVNIAAPDRYIEFHDALLLGPGRINGDRALAVAEEIGLDMDKIRDLVPSDEVAAVIAANYALADKLSLTGTPSYVTAKEVVIGAVGFETLKEKIEDARGCTSASC